LDQDIRGKYSSLPAGIACCLRFGWVLSEAHISQEKRARSRGSGAGTETLLNVDLHGRVKPAFQESERDLGWAIPSPDGRRVAIWEASGRFNAWLLENF
jgi:hypothetical protein